MVRRARDRRYERHDGEARDAPRAPPRATGGRRGGGRRRAAAGDRDAHRLDDDRDPQGSSANGPWVTQGGWEYNAVLIAALTALADNGPGTPSIDAKVFPRLHGAGWALASITAGVAGSYLAGSPPFNEPPEPEPAREPTGRFTRVEEPAAVDS
jgi:hypothetical protein